MRFLSKQDHVMARTASELKAVRQAEMDRFFRIAPNYCHARQRASNGNVLKESAAVLSAQHIGSIGVIR
jgi:hypothetical protein